MQEHADKTGEGLKSSGLKDAVFENFSNGMKVTIFRKNEFISSEGTEFDINQNNTTEKILLLVEENPKITTVQLAEKTGLSIDGINYNIKKLKKANKIARIGGDKGGYWEVL